MVKFILHISLFVLVSGTCLGQKDYWNELQKANDKIIASKHYKADIVYKVFDADNPKSLLDQQTGKYIVVPDGYYHKIGKTVTIARAGQFLVVDKPNKLMMLGKTERELGGRSFADVDITKYKPFVQSISSANHHGITRYTLLYKADAAIQKVYVDVNISGNITGITYFYNEEIEYQEGNVVLKVRPKIEISFINISTDQAFNKALDFSKYIRSNSNPVKPTLEYEDYELYINY